MMTIRCETDLALFGRIFFPHYCRVRYSRLHRHLFDQHRRRRHPVVLERRGRNYAVAAPRGYAKSTIVSLLLLAHDLVYRSEGYIVLVSATLAQSVGKLKSLQTELTTNEKLIAHYGPDIESTTTRRLVVNGIAVEAFSVGTELRGITWRQYRPTKIVIDDGEDTEAAESPELREKLDYWFREVLENLGNGYTNIIVVGTLLHPDSLLAKILKRPDFESKVFRAVESFADNTALWEQWRARYTDLADPCRIDTARRFFEEHQSAMVEGAKVLWSEKENYHDLMGQLTSRGRKAFYKEKQNEPRHHEAQIFAPETFRYFRLLPESDIERSTQVADSCNSENDGAEYGGSDRTVVLDDLARFGFLDLALGGVEGDYAAVATVGRDRHGYLYVLDIWMERASPTRQVARIFDLHEVWNYRLFGFEANCFQSLLLQPIEDERGRRRAAGRAWDLPTEELNHRENKLRRIASLESLIANGWLLFSRHLPEAFFQQAEQFPRAAHDDALDALEAAVALARRNPGRGFQPAGRKRTTHRLEGY